MNAAQKSSIAHYLNEIATKGTLFANKDNPRGWSAKSARRQAAIWATQPYATPAQREEVAEAWLVIADALAETEADDVFDSILPTSDFMGGC